MRNSKLIFLLTIVFASGNAVMAAEEPTKTPGETTIDVSTIAQAFAKVKKGSLALNAVGDPTLKLKHDDCEFVLTMDGKIYRCTPSSANEKRGSQEVVATASKRQLQAFSKKHGNTKNLWHQAKTMESAINTMVATGGPDLLDENGVPKVTVDGTSFFLDSEQNLYKCVGTGREEIGKIPADLYEPFMQKHGNLEGLWPNKEDEPEITVGYDEPEITVGYKELDPARLDEKKDTAKTDPQQKKDESGENGGNEAGDASQPPTPEPKWHETLRKIASNPSNIAIVGACPSVATVFLMTYKIGKEKAEEKNAELKTPHQKHKFAVNFATKHLLNPKTNKFSLILYGLLAVIGIGKATTWLKDYESFKWLRSASEWLDAPWWKWKANKEVKPEET